jgi:hypothetical protein
VALRIANSGLRIAVAFAVLLMCFALAPSVDADEVLDRVLAVVGGEMITLTDVTAARDLGLIAAGSTPDPIRAILSRLIDRQLILAEVDRYAPSEPAADAVGREVGSVRARFATDQAFHDALMRSGIDERHLRETVRQDLRTEAYLNQRFAVAPWTDEELGAYYRDHQPLFVRDGVVLPFDAVRAQVVQVASADRRRMLVDEWVAGLRRRSDIIDLYIVNAPPAGPARSSTPRVAAQRAR